LLDSLLQESCHGARREFSQFFVARHKSWTLLSDEAENLANDKIP